VRAVHARELLAFAGCEVADAQALQPLVPTRAPLGCDALRDRARDLVLVVRGAHELEELFGRHADLREQCRAHAGHEVIFAQIAAAQRRARFVDRTRQEHQAGEPRARIARRSPAQADRAHRFDGSGKP
jgi:hypothetical protein